MLVLRGRFPAFREVLSPQTVKLFVVWLVGCMIATYANIWQVGNPSFSKAPIASCGAISVDTTKAPRFYPAAQPMPTTTVSGKRSMNS
jgi:hypothetical protein